MESGKCVNLLSVKMSQRVCLGKACSGKYVILFALNPIIVRLGHSDKTFGKTVKLFLAKKRMRNFDKREKSAGNSVILLSDKSLSLIHI